MKGVGPMHGHKRHLRHFTIAEANAMIPTLEKFVRRLQALLDQARARYREMEMIKAVGYREDGTLIMAVDYRQAKEEFERAIAEANEIVEQINSSGCQLKSIELGLVDFPARIHGQEVWLCWKLGEPAVRFYHGLEDGYAGRRPIPPEALAD